MRPSRGLDSLIRAVLLWGVVSAAALKSLAALSVPLLFATQGGGASGAFPIEVHYLHILVFALVGSWLILGGHGDPRCSFLGALFLVIGAMFSDRVLEGIDAVTGTGRAMRALRLLDPVASSPWLMWEFAARFPRPIPDGRWRLATVGIRRTAGLAGTALFAASIVATGVVVWHPDRPAPPLGADSSLYWVLLMGALLAALLAIVLNAWSASVTEQRRVRLFVGGLVVGFAPMATDVLFELAIPAFGRLMNRPDVRVWSGLVLYPLLLSVPLTTSYAVVVDHALDVRLLIRRAIQYALARATLLLVVIVPFGLFLAYLYRHRAEPILSLVQGGRPVVIGVLLAMGVGLLPIRKQLLLALDRKFFREQYDAHVILRALIEKSSTTTSLAALADLVEGEIDRALHLRSVVLFTLDERAGAFVSRRPHTSTLPAEATLAVLLRGSSEPLDAQLDRRGSALARLPADERAWVRDTEAEMLVPIHEGAPPILVGLLALGAKLSELPFSAEDRSLLSAIGASSAVVSQNIRLRTPNPAAHYSARRVPEADAGPAKECPRCGILQAAEHRECPTCRGSLADASVPLVIRETYRVERRVGVGGMGVVYKATDLNLGRWVAVKTLPQVSPKAVAMVRREARAMAAVSDLHLATIFAVEIWRNTPVLIVEYFEGGTLADRLRAGPLPLQAALTIVSGVASGLEHLHAKGILHRDIKPSNIAFTAGGVPKLLDFGVAKLVETDRVDGSFDDGAGTRTSAGIDASVWTDAHRIIGTPLYLSPECVAEEPPDPRVDLWALAMVLYESVSGIHPLRAATVSEILARVSRADVPDVRDFVPVCPAFADFLTGALHRDAARRPASARQMSEQLADVSRRCLDSSAG